MHRENGLEEQNETFFELSLAVGQALQVEENCRLFLVALIGIQGITGGAVWLYDRYSRNAGAGQLRLTGSLGEAPILSSEEELLAVANAKNRRREVSPARQLQVFPLKNAGFLFLSWDPTRIAFDPDREKNFQRVLRKFAVSLEGSEAYLRLKETERRNAAIERKQRQILETSLDAIILVDGNALIRDWGPRAEQLFGYSAEEAVGKRWYQMVQPAREWQVQDEFLNRYKRFGEFPAVQYEALEITAINRDGREFPAEFSYSHISVEGEDHFCLFLRDISNRKMAHSELLKAQSRLKALIVNIQAGILVESEYRTIILANQHFCDLFNIPAPPEALIGQDCSQAAEQSKDLFKDPGAFISGIEQLLERRQVRTGEILEMSDGRILERDYIPVYIEEEYLGHMWQYRDITSRKRFESELQEAKKTAEAAKLAERKFLTSMSHEIRTPMNTVIGMIHLLEESSLAPSQKEVLDALKFSADSLLGIIDNILDLSKIEAGQIEFKSEPFRLRSLMESLRQSYQLKMKGKPVEVRLQVDERIEDPVWQDPTRLNQILNNLLSNAAKNTDSGFIEMEVTWLKGKEDLLWLEFLVRDSGVGITKDQIPLIFQNFKQVGADSARRREGSGLGLSIVKQLVEMQGGRIQVESQPGRGTEFRFTLPFTRTGSVEKSETVAAVDIEPPGNLLVLVVEDNPMNLLLITRILSNWGYRYKVAANGNAALDVLEQMPFHVMLVDLHLPDIDGAKLTSRLRSASGNPNQNIPVIALTAAALEDEKDRIFSAGVNDFLTKPFSPYSLKKLLTKWLGKPRQENPGNTGPSFSPSVDFKYLYDFSRGDLSFIREMVTAFLEETPLQMQDLEKAWRKSDWEGMFQVTHQMKSGFGMVGLDDLQAGAVKLEAALRKEEIDPNHVESLYNSLKKEIAASLPEVKRKLKLLTKF